MEKVTLRTLYKDTAKRSTLIAVPSVIKLLKVPNSEFTEWEVFHSIVREALMNWEYYFPLCIKQRIHVVVDRSGESREIFDNFDQFIYGKIPEDEIQIKPSTVTSIEPYSSFGYSTGVRGFRYENSQFKDFMYPTGAYYCECICRRPFPEIYNEVTKEPEDTCAVYYLSRDLNSDYSIFADELYLQFCKYVMNIRKNIMLQNMPIELFQGLEEDYNRLESKLQGIYQQAMVSNYWIR